MQTAKSFRFGDFELDVCTGELKRLGIRIRLQEQSFQILMMMLERPGEVVLRDEIRRKLWPNDTVVEFDHSINAAIKRLRMALGESAEEPQFIETLAKRGYRFAGGVERMEEPEEDSPDRELGGNVMAHYRLLGKLGEGGMGVVYKAEDMKLGRLVAVKCLPVGSEDLTESALRRFEREARAASALNHPNICTVYGVEEFDGKPAIVMELVEGETLAARLERGPMQIAESLRIAIQIAGALAEAHRRGVVHRDLKPANIMLTRAGVKVMDFGLARIENPMGPDSETSKVTLKGAILGTLHYMSPEQANGKEADRRSDIFSFGVVLYEMLTGRKPFNGESAASVMVGILEHEPPAFSEAVPGPLDRVVRRCLAKDAEERWQSAGDLKAELEWIAQGSAANAKLPTVTEQGSRWGGRMLWSGIAAGAAVAALAGMAILRGREKPLDPPMVRFSISLPENATFGSMPGWAVSPDGRKVVLVTLWKNSYMMWLRSLDSVTPVPLPSSEGMGMYLPFWSPDSKSIGFFSGGKLKRIDLGGVTGDPPAVTVCDLELDGAGGTWNRDGVILFAQADGRLYRVPDTGGTPAPVGKLDASRHEKWNVRPWFLPDGRHFLYSALSTPIPPEHVTIRAGSLDSAERTIVREADSNAIFVGGRLLFVLGDRLVAQRFDPRTLTLSGAATPVADHVEVSQGGMLMGFFAASEGGVLVYNGGEKAPFEAAWFDRGGKRESPVISMTRFAIDALELSPDRRTAALPVEEQTNEDLWLYDVAEGRRTRFTFDPGRDTTPVWSADGKWIVFSSNRKGPYDLYRRAADQSGPEEVLYADGADKNATSWSPDGKYVLYNRHDEKGVADIWVLPLGPGQAGGVVKPFPYLPPPARASNGRFSPDGKWVVYQSSESGRSEIYVAPFQTEGDPGGAKRQTSSNGGSRPRWRRDGKEIFYTLGRRLVETEVEMRDRTVRVGTEQPLIDGVSIQGYDVSADGQRFLILLRSREVATRPLTLVENFTAALNFSPGQK
jgi:eukaryotic-like serine/threonine-protein kinase